MRPGSWPLLQGWWLALADAWHEARHSRTLFEATRILADPYPGRIVALDYGRRRIGVAATDPSRTIASPHGALPNQDPPDVPPEALIRLLVDLEPTVLLLGIPVNADGSAGEMAAEVRRFGERLEAAGGVEIEEWDERFTSEEAAELIHELDLPRKRRQEKGLLDALAALVILREYLSSDGAAR